VNTPLNGDDYRKGAAGYANEELERLRAENHYLRRLLSEHGICITASPVKHLQNHLTGRETIGAYPLLPDKEGWKIPSTKACC
jgi:hypothetical protein